MVALLAVVPLLVAVNEGITLPVPDANSPMLTLLLVQAKVVPVMLDEKTSLDVFAPLQTV